MDNSSKQEGLGTHRVYLDMQRPLCRRTEKWSNISCLCT